jgi:hypothetical protein
VQRESYWDQLIGNQAKLRFSTWLPDDIEAFPGGLMINPTAEAVPVASRMPLLTGVPTAAPFTENQGP